MKIDHSDITTIHTEHKNKNNGTNVLIQCTILEIFTKKNLLQKLTIFLSSRS